MAIFVIIYFGLQAGFSLLKLHPFGLRSCLKSCNRNELRFTRKGNVYLPTKCFCLIRVYQPQILHLERYKAFFQMKSLAMLHELVIAGTVVITHSEPSGLHTSALPVKSPVVF